MAACLAICALLAGCNGFTKPFINDPVYSQYLVVNSGPPLPLFFQGSAIQWNDDYAVTAKHIPFLWNIAHKGKGDVVFFKHKSKRVPEWRQYTAGEKLTAVGFSPFLVSMKGTGHAKASRVMLLSFNDNISYGIGDMPIVKGMSGGPVFGEDNRVVGINVAFLPESSYLKSNNPEITGSDRVSVFLPYDEILKEWNIFAMESKSLSYTPSPAEAP